MAQTKNSRSLFLHPYRIDAHIHTLPANPNQEIIEREAYRVKKTVDTAAEKGLDAIVLTDFGHTGGFNVLYNNIKIDGKWLFGDEYERKKEESAVKVKSNKYAKDLAVFLGEEIATKQGEVLGCFIKDYISIYNNLTDTIKEINNQGGVVVFPHPLATFPGAGGLGRNELIKQCLKKDYPRAIEVFNGQLAFPTSYFDNVAKKLADSLDEFQIGGSDARGYKFKQYNRVGSVYTEFTDLKEISKDSIRDYIKKKGKTRIKGTHNNLAVVGAMMAPVAIKQLKKKIIGK